MSQLQQIGAIERRLWSSADQLRANSTFAANEYFLPVMGLIFLRHAYSRFLKVKDEIEPSLPSRGGVRRALTKDDFQGRGALYLQPLAQFDTLAKLLDGKDLAGEIKKAMESIEDDYPVLKGSLPTNEYQELSNDVLRVLLTTFNDDRLRTMDGDIFGRIYEYFLTEFAGLKAHDGGEFFTPVSLVQMIVNVLEPEHGRILDPACGSGGMFVQSAHFIERQSLSPMNRVTFYGMEKNATTVRLAKMNLAVHGLEGDIAQAITYYEDPHTLVGKADFVMANPPFNVDEIDADKLKTDRRVPFGLPLTGKGSVSNGNYVWISYFYSYLNARGRAGFVMSSQASSAGGAEREVRQKLVETGAVDVMMAIRGGFFYTRPVPCELWFLDRGAPESRRESVLMLDARAVHSKVTRVIYEFSPEQLANLTAIVWLYREEQSRFLGLVASYLERSQQAATETRTPIDRLHTAQTTFDGLLTLALDAKDAGGQPFRKHPKVVPALDAYTDATAAFATDEQAFHALDAVPLDATDNAALHDAARTLAPMADDARRLAKDAEGLHKRATALMAALDGLDESVPALRSREIRRASKALSEAATEAADALKRAHYFHKNAEWLQSRFPDAVLVDVPGLVKRVGLDEIARNDYSLTPGRYVGTAPEEDDEDFDFEATMTALHDDLASLNAQAAELAERIAQNFAEVLG